MYATKINIKEIKRVRETQRQWDRETHRGRENHTNGEKKLKARGRDIMKSRSSSAVVAEVDVVSLFRGALAWSSVNADGSLVTFNDSWLSGRHFFWSKTKIDTLLGFPSVFVAGMLFQLDSDFCHFDIDKTQSVAPVKNGYLRQVVWIYQRRSLTNTALFPPKSARKSLTPIRKLECLP